MNVPGLFVWFRFILGMIVVGRYAAFLDYYQKSLRGEKRREKFPFIKVTKEFISIIHSNYWISTPFFLFCWFNFMQLLVFYLGIFAWLYGFILSLISSF